MVEVFGFSFAKEAVGGVERVVPVCDACGRHKVVAEFDELSVSS